MDELLGRHIEDREFDAYLGNWRHVMMDRIERASDAISAVPGVSGLVLAGSNGIGNPWPLSDIDLIPVYEESLMDAAMLAVEGIRLDLLDAWSQQGWRTGVDVGRLRFGTAELELLFASGDPEAGSVLQDDRWYHSIDKAYRGRALLDRDSFATRLVDWLTSVRFSPEVVNQRLERASSEVLASLALAAQGVSNQDRVGAYAALLKGIQWYQIYLMESWGERDNSLGRFGTRFEINVHKNGASETCELMNRLASMTVGETVSRLAHAPWWVLERHDRSWKARERIDEPVTRLQNDRDVLRVCTIYELRHATGPEYEAWLAVPDEVELRERIEILRIAFPADPCVFKE